MERLIALVPMYPTGLGMRSHTKPPHANTGRYTHKMQMFMFSTPTEPSELLLIHRHTLCLMPIKSERFLTDITFFFRRIK